MKVTPVEFDGFRRVIRELSGIALPSNKAYLVEGRLGPLIAKFALTGFKHLLTELKDGKRADIRCAVIDCITTNETLWFRDSSVFETIASKLLPERIATGRGKLRFWSAAASTGQEAYSLAMLCIEERKRLLALHQRGVQILGTDICNTALDQARRGVYDDMAMSRGLSQVRREDFFTHGEKGWQLDARVKALVSFEQANLMFPTQPERFDLVLLRYVLIYFDDDTRKRIIKRIARSLKPGAYLLVGATENISAYLPPQLTSQRIGRITVFRHQEAP